MTTGLAGRHVDPERLDAMLPEAPAALASRRDLRRINALMFQSRILAGLLEKHVPCPPRSVVDLGCGDGHVALAVARTLAPAWPGVTLTLLDAQSIVTGQVRTEIAALGWNVEVITADVFDWLGGAEPQDVAIANLFLHHFAAPALTELLGGVARLCGTFVATEPRRSAFALVAARSVGAIGANAVTRHDAPVSVRAGFRGAELTSFWRGRVCFEGARGPLTHAFVATTRPEQ